MASLKILQSDGTYKKIKLNGDVVQTYTQGTGVTISEDGVISAEVTESIVDSKIQTALNNIINGEENEY